MKADKKLKNLIEKQGLELKAKNYDFYNQMLNAYPEEEKKVSFFEKFASWFSVKKIASVACSLIVLVLAVISLSNVNFNGIGNEVEVPVYAERVASVTVADINVSGLNEVHREVDLMFGETPLSLGDVEIYEDVNLNNEPCYYFATKAYKKNGYYRLQLITDTSYGIVSNLTAKTQNINVKGVEFVYSTLYVEQAKTVYFFAESKKENQILMIDFTTTAKDSEKQFIDLLNSIIL